MKYFWFLLALVLAYLIYVLAVIGFGTLNDYKPEEKIAISIKNKQQANLNDSASISLMIWNIGYSGLGAENDFFLDGGKMVRPTQEVSEGYLNGIIATIKKHADTDFFLLQEVDVKSKRSYGINQFEEIAAALPKHSSAHALNFSVKFVPKPLMSFSPIGHVQSGLATYSKYKASSSTRFQFPGEYDWPVRVFHLDRCMLETRIPVANGKELIVINSHNSAYDGGKLKPLEMAYLKAHLLAEYEKGNYVLVGADWNQCPPNFAYDTFAKNTDDTDYYQDNISNEFVPENWTWAYDKTVATNRKLATPYVKGETFTTLIDFYLLSPNLKVKTVKGLNLDFAYSDHQPVLLTVQLN